MISEIFKSDGRPIDWRWLELQLLFIAFVIGLPFGIATAPSIFRDGDVSWHIAAGNWILDHAQIPTSDPFSFTAVGHPWIATEWLSELILALAFKAAGHAGLATVVAASLIAVNGIIFFHLQRRNAALPWASLIGMNVVLMPFVMARPHVLAWPLLAVWTVLLLNYANEKRPPPLWSAVLLAFWANLHTSFPLAAPIGAAIALDCLIETRWKTLPQWLLFAFVSLIAIMANANGLGGILQPFHISNLNMLRAIGEWNPTTTQNTPEFYVIVLMGIGALLWQGVRVPIGRLGLLLVMLGMAFVHIRHQTSFIIVAACVVPPLFPANHNAKSVPKWIMLAALPLLAARALFPLTPPESKANPRNLIAAIPPELRNQPVFNGYTFGGPLILADIRPYIDGRAEMYGDTFFADYVRMLDGDAERFNRTATRYNIRWTMLPQRNKLADELEASGKWRRIYADKVGMIHVRQ
jgi:hypothetical protein